MEKISFNILFGSIFGGVGALFAVLGVIFFVNIDSMAASAGSGDIIILPLVFTGIGFLFVAIGLPFIIADNKKKNNIKRVIAEGNYVFAKVVEINPNLMVTINGRHPYVFECQYEDPFSGEIHVFRSGNLMYFPENLLDTDVRVWVDRNNYDIYYVDMESVPNRVHVH